MLLALVVSEGLLRVLVATEIMPPDKGFGGFVHQLENAQNFNYDFVQNYTAAAFGGPAPGLFRRSEDTVLGWEPVPGMTAGHIRINAGGFRGPEYAMERPSGRRRVALLGDSEVFGMRLAEHQTLSGAIESQLNEQGGGESFEVLNFGVPAYNTVQELALLESKVLQYEPDAVVVCYCFNDPEISTRGVLVGSGPLSRTYLGLFAAYWHGSIEALEEMRGASGDIVDYYRRLHESAYFEPTKSAIRRMGDTLAERDVPLFVLIGTELAGYEDLRDGYPYDEIHASLAELASDRITVVDPKPQLTAESADPRGF